MWALQPTLRGVYIQNWLPPPFPWDLMAPSVFWNLPSIGQQLKSPLVVRAAGEAAPNHPARNAGLCVKVWSQTEQGGGQSGEEATPRAIGPSLDFLIAGPGRGGLRLAGRTPYQASAGSWEAAYSWMIRVGSTVHKPVRLPAACLWACTPLTSLCPCFPICTMGQQWNI